MSVCAVVGGQFGSEGKGLIVGRIAKEYDCHVRVGAANAGHTFYTQTLVDDDAAKAPHGWEKHVMQQIPCAAYAHPGADLFIGPGALISPEIFERELIDLARWRRHRGLRSLQVHLDPRAHVIMRHQIEREQQTDLAKRIGSTSATAGEGVGVAQSDRVMRTIGCMTASNYYTQYDEVPGLQMMSVPRYLAHEPNVLLEGTQGAGLSLTTGVHPYITSRNTTSAGLAADCGIAPHRVNRVILVVRTFPIRVAGHSGPFAPGSEEIAWDDINIDPETERTTVTKKIRRVATFSIEQVAEAAYLNGATEIALTFCDYLDPELKGVGSSGYWTRVGGLVGKRIEEIEDATGVPVRWLGTGPWSTIHLRDDR